MRIDARIQQNSLAELNSDQPAKHSPTIVEIKESARALAGHFEGIAALDAKLVAEEASLLAESFLKSPLARAMLERGEPFKFFLPIQHRDCTDWGGVNITIAGVTKKSLVADLERSAALRRGGSQSRSPYGLLKPGDYGVHSHPDTAKLTKSGPGGA